MILSALAPTLPNGVGGGLATPQMILFAVFFFLVGACVGSFLNVLIWRLPNRGHEVLFLDKRGPMTLSWPPSHCPMCDAPIHWYQNIPVLSYILLRARCANCHAHIPIRYPLVELATSLLWGGIFLAYFVAHTQGPVCWLKSPNTGVDNLLTDWAPYVWHALFASALLAASAIDADLFIIPLSIPWFLAILGIVGAACIGSPLTRDYAIVPTLTTNGWVLAKPVIGAALGLILANVLLHFGILPRSFPWEYEPIPDDNLAGDSEHQPGADKPDPTPAGAQEQLAPPPKLTRFWPVVIATLLIAALIAFLWIAASFTLAAIVGVAGAIFIFLLGVLPRDAGQIDVTDEVMDEITEGNVRLEILKEVLFLAVPLALALIAYLLPLQLPQAPWLMRLLGSLFGILVGGGVVWLIRIGGTLAFNKQAMGIGDVHLMAGVGAVLGAPLVLIAFFTAPFVAIFWALILKILGKPNVLPYGPWLSVASIMALFLGNPILCFYLALFP
jgi:prepilin signal peptidase PulO-like enzyme (type II secretory pathway)